MQKLILPLISLVAGVALGAGVYAAVAKEPERTPVATTPEFNEPAPDNGGELKALREENRRIAEELVQARAAKPETPESQKPTQPQPEVVEPPETPEPAPALGDASPEEALRRILGREPLSDELAQFKKWLERKPPDPTKIDEAFQNGDADNLLKLLAANPDASAGDLLEDSDGFQALLKRVTPDEFLTLEQAKERDVLPDGAVIDIPHGIHTLDLDNKYRTELPRDILIRGAGMDSTLLRVGEMSARSGLRQLHFQDLTLDCANNYMTDLRRDTPSTMRFTNVRFIRFDKGSGASALVASPSMVFLATDCEFVNGYGLSPGSGTPFVSGGVMLVRVENSTFVGPFSRIYRNGGNRETECFLTGCTFFDCKPDGRGVKTESSFVQLNKPDEIEQEDWDKADDARKLSYIQSYSSRKPKPLTDINPAWRE